MGQRDLLEMKNSAKKNKWVQMEIGLPAETKKMNCWGLLMVTCWEEKPMARRKEGRRNRRPHLKMETENANC